MKKFLALSLTAILAVSALAGCGGSGGSTAGSAASSGAPASSGAASSSGSEAAAPAGDVSEITYMTNVDFLGSLAPCVEAYEAETGVKVNLDGYAFADLFDVIEIKIGSGSTEFDVLAIDAPMVTSYATREMLLNLNDYFTEDEKKQLTDVSVSAGSYDGGFYAPAMNTSANLMFYNTQLLEEAGITLPEGITVDHRITYEALVELCKQGLQVLDPDGNNGIYGLEFRQVSRVYQMNPIPNSMGGKNMGDDNVTVDGIINDDIWVKALTWYQGLVNDRVATRGISADEMRNLFVSDKIMFMIDTTSLVGFCAKNDMDHYAYLPVPAFEGYEDKVATATGSWHFGVNVDSQKKDAAADFIKFMSIGDGQDIWWEMHQQLPTKVALLEELDASADSPEWLKIAVYESANTAVLRALTPGFNEYSDILGNAWEDIRNGEEVQKTLDDAVTKINSAFEKYK